MLVLEGRDDAQSIARYWIYEEQGNIKSMDVPKVSEYLERKHRLFFIMSISTQFYRIGSLHPPRHPVTASTLRDTEKETCCIRANHLYRCG
jgi:hypothetical protein